MTLLLTLGIRHYIINLAYPFAWFCNNIVLDFRLEERITVYPADVVLFEGILVFYPVKVRDMFHMKLFVDTDSDVRLSRRGTAVSTAHNID